MYRLNLTNKHILKDKLEKYAQMIYEYNQNVNLTGFKTFEDIFNFGIIDSILAFDTYQKNTNYEFKSKKVLDVGAGSGLPSIPYLIYCDNNFELTIVESLTKRCAFLELVKKEFNLNLNIINNRSEEINTYNNYFDIVTARAVGTLKMLNYISNHMLNENGYFIMLKGKNYAHELQEFKIAFESYNHQIEVFEYQNMENDLSYVVEIKKQYKTPKNWPLKWKNIKNKI